MVQKGRILSAANFVVEGRVEEGKVRDFVKHVERLWMPSPPS